jgi:hypothetical protein
MLKTKKSKTLLLVFSIIVVLLITFSFIYSKGYLDNLFNREEEISLPQDYKEPTLSLKSEYSQGIIYENSESFNIKDYVDYTAYDNKASIWYELLNDTNNKSSINKVGQYPITINLKDKYDKTIKLETIIYTYNHLQNVLTNLQEGTYNGTWLSSEINDTHFQFEINYPKVCDSNGNTGEIVVSDNNTYDFSIIFTQNDISSEFRVSTQDNGSTLLWLPNNDGTFTTSLSFTRSDDDSSSESVDTSDSSSTNTSNKKSGHYEMKLVKEAYDETIPAYDETVIVKDAWTEQVLVKDAWDEECTECTAWGPDTVECYECTNCHFQTLSGEEIYSHIRWTEGCGSFFNGTMYLSDEIICKQYDTYTKHHDAEYNYIYHEAETKVVHHDAETVHHEAQYKKVWVED